jgi:hypothetical protein
MIGSTVRLGFDATAVQKGLGGLGGLFGRIGRQIGMGGLQRVGHQITDLMGRIIVALPAAGKEMLDWAGNMTDMSAQTGVSIQRLLVMEDALRMSGATVRDTSMMISRLAINLHEASQGAEAQKDALNKLGFSAQDLKDMSIDDAFYAIGKAASELPADFKGVESIMSDLFGGIKGVKMIRFFRSFDSEIEKSKKNVSGFNKVSDETFGHFDSIADTMGRWATTRRSLLAGLFEGVAGERGIEGAAASLGAMFDKLEGMSDKMREIGKIIRNSFQYIQQEGLGNVAGEVFKALGKSIGEGIAESIKAAMPDMAPKGLLKSLNPFASNSSDPLLKENQKQTGYLAKIQRDGVTAKFG